MLHDWTPLNTILAVYFALPPLAGAVVAVVLALRGQTDKAIQVLSQQVNTHSDQIGTLLLNTTPPNPQGKP